jgi:hypothetical protein
MRRILLKRIILLFVAVALAVPLLGVANAAPVCAQIGQEDEQETESGELDQSVEFSLGNGCAKGQHGRNPGFLQNQSTGDTRNNACHEHGNCSFGTGQN